MGYVVLARKWRPQTFADLVGQEHVARTLSNAIATDRVAHAFLFTGVRGVGKTTSARILAKTLNCMQGDGPTSEPCLECAACVEIAEGTDVDVQEIDGASYNGVDEVRRLQEGLPYLPQRDRYKIVIVDEVHMLSTNAWNAFLKTLEEPPAHVKFIFATTEVHKVPVTILSRVQRFDFKLISAAMIGKRLREVLSQEKIVADDRAIALMSREAAGSMRDGMSILDQAIAWGGNELVGDDVARVLGVASHEVLYDLAGSLLVGEPSRCLEIVAALAEQGFDIEHVARDTLSLLRDLVVAKVCKDSDALLDLADEERADVRRLAGEAHVDDLLRLQRGFAQSFDEVARSGQPRAALEMLLVRLALRPPLIPLDDLIERLAILEKRTASTTTARPHAPTGTSNNVGGARRGSGREHGTPSARQQPGSESRDEPPPAPPARAELRSVEWVDNQVPSRGPARAEAETAASPAPAVAARTPAPVTAPAVSTLVTRTSSPARDAWRLVVEAVDDSVQPGLRAMLEHAAPLELTNEALIVGYPASSIFPAYVETNEAQRAIREASERALPGRTVNVRVDAPDDKSLETVASENARLEAERQRQVIEDARSHPAVRDAKELLGARITEIRLRKRG